jgi:hypothetical protein
MVWHRPLAAAPVPVRFVEGSLHGFLVLSTPGGVPIASGDLLQVGRDGGVKSRLVFRFKDGSVFDETVVFTQRNVFTLQSYHLVQRGPVWRIELTSPRWPDRKPPVERHQKPNL